MKPRVALLLATAALFAPAMLPHAPALALPAGDKKVDLPAVVKSVAAYMKKKDLGKRDPEDIAKKIAGLGEEDLAWVLDRLREVPEKDRGAAAAPVEKILEDALLSARYSPAILRIPEAAKRLADTAPAARCTLMADLSRLEDAEPATRFCLWALSGGADQVRLRAIDVLADLASWGGDPARILPALEKALSDPSAAVRDLALERLAAVCHPAALDWSIEHLAEPAEETTAVREIQDRRCPGERALDIATRAAKLHFGMSAEEFRALPEAERDAIRAELRAWRGKAGPNPLRDGDEGPFDPVPKIASAVVDPLKDPRATVRWWSDLDRAQFRLDLDEMEVAAATKVDWFASFRLTVIASGARQGNWESFARRLRCGVRHRLPRKGFGLVETSIQPLIDGKWKVWVRSYEWKGK